MTEQQSTPSNDIQVHGDLVQDDKVGGDKIGGDKITVAGNYIAAAERPPIWVNVPSMPQYFVGRDGLMQELIAKMTGGSSLALSAEGLPGVGKTTLAVALAHRAELLTHFKDGVLWGGLGQQADVISILNSWADGLGVDVADMVNVADRSRAVGNAIGQRRLLLLIDDAWDAEAAKLLRCGGPHCCHLLTTRNVGIARQFAKQSLINTVPTLAERPAYGLLQTLAPEACAANPAAAKVLADAVGGLPLALELLGGYLAMPERSLFPELSEAALDELTDPQRRLQLAQARLGNLGQVESLQETITLSLDELGQSDRGKAAVATFYRVGAFAPKPAQFSKEAALAVAETDVATLALLAGRNLIEIEDGALLLHQTLADVARTQLDEAAASRHRTHYLAGINADRHDWQTIQAIYEQVKWAWQQAADDETLFEFVYAAYTYQSRRGLWHDYIDWVKKCLTVAEGLDKQKQIGSFLTHLGFIYNNLGQRDKALEFYNRALPIRQEIGDKSGEGTTLNNISQIFKARGDYDTALDFLQRSLKISQEIGDKSGEGTTLNNMATTAHARGDYDTALDFLQRSLKISQEIGDRYGESITRYNIATILRVQGHLELAVEQLKQVVELDRLLQHPDLESDRAFLAQVEAELAALG